MHIFYGENATSIEKTALEDLLDDLEQVGKNMVETKTISQENFDSVFSQLPEGKQIIVIGTLQTNPALKSWAKKGLINLSAEIPGERGGIVKTILFRNEKENEIKALVLGGSDPQGAQYAIYSFSHNDLGVDPFQYWTGVEPNTIEDFSIEDVSNRVVEPPIVPILGYFDNDNDELANMTKPYLEFSFEHWKEIIKSLVRLKYNAIDIHDHLGRAEFYRWPHYKKIRPNYKPNTELLNKVIDYAHERGMMIQVSFYLGWKFKVISDKASLNWKKYKEEWKEVWTYYLKETPIGKCDIFLNRPRDQRWDRKYRGRGDPADVFNEAFPAMASIIKEHNPEAKIIVDLYSEGRGVYKNGFRPKPKEDFIMVWPDDGFGDFEYMPESQHGYDFGIYMHAGFFRNHVVQDPYPELLAESMKNALVDHEMTEYCLVNGQTFRHYLLNMEACSKICANPTVFSPEEFYQAWTTRYFGSAHSNEIVDIFKALHHAQEHRMGYMELMIRLKFSALRVWIRKYLKFVPKKLINYLFEKFANMGESYTKWAKENVEKLQAALDKCNEIKDEVDNPIFFHDHVLLQVKLLLQLNHVVHQIQLASSAKDYKTHVKKAVEKAKEHHKTRLEGDKDPEWQGWYDPKARRPNGGYFDLEKLEKKGKIKITNLK